MKSEEQLHILDQLVFQKIDRHLKDVEIIILQGAWDNLSYDEIASKAGYAAKYLRQDVGFKLWKILSDVLGEEVGKTNFRSAIERINLKFSFPENIESITEYPEGSVPLNSPFYLERFPHGENRSISLEAKCYDALTKNGALIRIKAPYKMGKTSLLDRLIAHSQQQSHHTVKLNLLQAEQEVFNSLDRFLQWFCAYITHRLKLPSILAEYWDEYRGSIVNATSYFEEHILMSIDHNIVLALDEVDRVLAYPEIAQGFFAMLRSWHEESKNIDIWENLRLIIVYSTENYGTLDINQSPFNVGLVVDLPEFTAVQIRDLAINHGLNYTEDKIGELMHLIGGHPYLIRLALYHLAVNKYPLTKILLEAPTNGGIYEEHLRRYLKILQDNINLHRAYYQIVNSTEAIAIETIVAYQLYSIGLVKRSGNKLMPTCRLYQQYFQENLLLEN